MKRLVPFGLLGALALVLGGCPIFDETPHDHGGDDCRGDRCAPPLGCVGPAECDVNETCGADNQCHTGDCSFWGCVSGFSCVVDASSTLSCMPDGASQTTGAGGTGAGGDASGGAGAGGAATGAGGGVSASYCGKPGDCGAGETCGPAGLCEIGDCTTIGCVFGFGCSTSSGTPACLPEDPAACGTDAECAANGASYACVSGLCAAPDAQCFDQAQCSAGSKCAAGKCTAACSVDAECASGFGCDVALGVCSKAVVACAITNDCASSDLVCVNATCVPRSVAGMCDAGLVWVQNGCIPDQTASSLCAVDGQQDACPVGSICLHHGCYVSCASPAETVCSTLPSYNVCKAVTTDLGAFSLCGSLENLGGECDTTAGPSCGATGTCVDGFCK